MRVTYDPEVDILLIVLEDLPGRRAGGRDLPFGGAYADLAADGTILQLEIENASARYPMSRLMEMEVVHAPLTLEQAAKRSDISIDALKKACQRGTLRGERFGHNWTVTQDALNAYIVSRWKRARKEAPAG
jgi:uncharacterized protein YuzE